MLVLGIIIGHELDIYGKAIVEGVAFDLGYIHASGFLVDKTEDQATHPVIEPVIK